MAAAASTDFSPALEKRVSRGSHTIVLVQLLPEITSRTYHDFERVDEALDGVIKMYERRLAELNPGVTQFSYELADLFKYLVSLADIAFLVFDPHTLKYDSYPVSWVQHQIYTRMRGSAAAE